MRRTNYKFEKRQKDLEKLRKKEEKQKRKLERKGLDMPDSSEDAGQSGDTAKTPDTQ